MNFSNPYYGNFNTPQQRMDQSNWNNRGWDSVRSSMNQNYLNGRLIFSPDQITPQEIPSDGTPAIFPLDDGSAIYVKSVKPDGSGFAEYKYVLEKSQSIENNAPVESSNVQQPIVQNVEKSSNYDDLVKRIDFLEQMVNVLLNGSAKADQNEANKEVEKNG